MCLMLYLKVADGLAFLHVKKIIYRDLKSDNILLFSVNPNVSAVFLLFFCLVCIFM